MESEIRSPMAGKVIEVLVTAGDTVAEDDELLVLESMKMEIPVAATRGGVVQQVHVAVEAIVQEGDPLLTLDVG
jgi:acetyl-CoA carboxylase biotin carboxyl carrier protein